ncbi:helix-turn-helix domain-containing protein [Pseudoduganella sp. UC29_106]|uniref:IclR family transcriptional regulator domain-containing protein n=1 Tax=Pseudoduganella sp. UC29_106 TaxID=3374553 RepID=UPI003757C020
MRPQALQDVEVAKRDLIEGLVKGLEVIRAFSDESVRLSASELSEKVGLTRSAARRYLLTLVHVGMAETDGRQFWLTPKVLSLGHSYLDSARLPRAIVPYLQRLTAQLQESTNYSVLEGDDVVYVSRVNAPRVLTPGFDPGTRLPAYTSTAGRVLLSALPDDELHAYLARVELVAYTHMTRDRQGRIAARTAGDSPGRFRRHREPVRGRHARHLGAGQSRRGELLGALSVSMSIASCSRAEATARCVPALQETANTVMLWV